MFLWKMVLPIIGLCSKHVSMMMFSADVHNHQIVRFDDISSAICSNFLSGCTLSCPIRVAFCVPKVVVMLAVFIRKSVLVFKIICYISKQVISLQLHGPLCSKYANVWQRRPESILHRLFRVQSFYYIIFLVRTW